MAEGAVVKLRQLAIELDTEPAALAGALRRLAADHGREKMFVHRDVDPSSLVAPDGAEADDPELTEFAVAKLRQLFD
jgi:hypothetical protein